MADTPERPRTPGVERQRDLASQARDLVHLALTNYDEQYGCGSMSCAIYDTAWVSMVTKHTDGGKQWLFPESFRFLLKCQSGDGSWGVSPFSQIDGILNTAAALLSLQKHAADALQMRDLGQDGLHERKCLAAASLARQLKAWNVEATRHVGFEVIVPALLELLENQDSSFQFAFQGKDTLLEINAAKMSRFRPELLYQVKTTAIHSLEAFIGKIDFDKVKHHLVHGSMMGSPSSTAAYLMYTSRWDDDAEAYLRHVIHKAAGQGSGGVPSAYPSLYFEHTWVLSTLLRAGFSQSDLESDSLATIRSTLHEAFRSGNGVIGFAPGFAPDVDDTAKGILSLNMLGSCIGAEDMISSFEADDHFRTYPRERDPSFSANCNALLALLHQQNASRYSAEILKAVRFLCSYWWSSDNGVKDKWNLCYLYPCLLLAEAFVDFLVMIQSGALKADLLDSNLRSRVHITLFQACSRALLDQQSDGSWMRSIEQTAYGVLILCEAKNLTFFESLRLELDDAIHRGISFLKSHAPESSPPELIWIEKVSYASPMLTEAYVLAAQKAGSRIGAVTIEAASGSGVHIEPTNMARYVQLFRQTPLFSSLPKWRVHLSALEAGLFMPLLSARRLEVFPRKDMEKDKYFEIIPFTWTSCNNRSRAFASTSFLYDMMVISFLNYQADEFMEAVAGPAFRGNLDGLRHLIDSLFGAEGVEKATAAHGANARDNADADSALSLNGSAPVIEDMPAIDVATRSQEENVRIPLRRFVSHVLGHPSITNASSWDRTTLTRELRTFLLAHVLQTEDNDRFSRDIDHEHADDHVFASAATSFFKWVRTTSANHTSCPYSFAFVSALISSSMAGGADCFPSAREKYLAEAACRHLATMCRMYNDYGSLTRDRIERNLNSINFPEFNCGARDGNDQDELKKAALFTIADYERCCLNLSLARLHKEDDQFPEVSSAEHINIDGAITSQCRELRSRKMAIWHMFCDVTDLYGQIYVVRDIASRMTISVSRVP